MLHLPVPITGDTYKTPSYAVYGGAGWLRSNSLGFSVRRNDHICHYSISYFGGGEETRTLKIPQCKCGAVTNFATPPIKNSHILLNCVSLIALYFFTWLSLTIPQTIKLNTFSLIFWISTHLSRTRWNE